MAPVQAFCFTAAAVALSIVNLHNRSLFYSVSTLFESIDQADHILAILNGYIQVTLVAATGMFKSKLQFAERTGRAWGCRYAGVNNILAILLFSFLKPDGNVLRALTVSAGRANHHLRI
ncbi:MAG: hypothetical protein V7735_12450 [Photobacterium frigidiphilum]|uniref:hypothetical protein n=1 Tax=Photobacterium frigidiphilum TaxID=264736 RepID=UPI0030015492